MSASSPSADRNLVFGLLALQMDFVTCEQLLDALHAWMLAKHLPLGDILRQRGVLSERQAVLLDALVDEHVARHGGDAQATLAALRVEPEVRSHLQRLDDPEVQNSIAALRPTSTETVSPATPPTDGQHLVADTPVSAHREPWSARAGRWLRRHQTLAATTAAILLTTLVIGGFAIWHLEQQAARQRRAVEAAVEAALEEVARLQQQARWPEARIALDGAESRLGEGADALRLRVEQARRDLDLVARLEAIRLKRATVVDGRFFDHAGADQSYQKAFRDAGIGEPGGDAAAAANRIRASPRHDVLVAALDDWTTCARDREPRHWLLEVARRADPDPWRNRARDPAVWDDRKALARLAEEQAVAEQSPQLLVAVAARLMGPEAARLLRAAQARHPGDFWINFTLGNALLDGKKAEEATRYYLVALALQPGTVAVHNNLGLALGETGRVDEAVAVFRKAIDLKPNDAIARTNLGNALLDKGEVDEAIAEFRKAIAIDPRDARTHGALRQACLRQGHFTEARETTQRWLKLLPTNDPLRKSVMHQLRECEQMLALAKKLPALLAGKVKPADAAEQVALARLCTYKMRPAAATRFYADAFTSEPKLADDSQAGHRYNAACTAAQAGCGQGKDDPRPDDKERTRLRQQALGWLRADLALWSKQASGTQALRRAAQKALELWQKDTDLAGVRDDAALEKLPEGERAEWKKLWAEVAALLKKGEER
jgi:Flp pilus assembly protein TadD